MTITVRFRALTKGRVMYLSRSLCNHDNDSRRWHKATGHWFQCRLNIKLDGLDKLVAFHMVLLLNRIDVPIWLLGGEDGYQTLSQ